MKGIPSFWVDSAARIDVAANKVTHKLAHGELVETASWLGEGAVTIGVTSGASTPDKAGEAGGRAGEWWAFGLQPPMLRRASFGGGCAMRPAIVCLPPPRGVLPNPTPPSFLFLTIPPRPPPPSVVEDVLDRVFRIKDPSFTGIAARKSAVVKHTHEEE